MKREWKIGRNLIEKEEGQRRWDSAFQQLLQWAQKNAVEKQEYENENSNVQSGLDNAPSATADNRATDKKVNRRN